MSLTSSFLPVSTSIQEAPASAQGVNLDLEQNILNGASLPEQEIATIEQSIDLRDPQTILRVTEGCTRDAGTAVDDILKSIRADSLPVLDGLITQIIDEGLATQKAVKGGIGSKFMDAISSVSSSAKRRIKMAQRAQDSMYDRCMEIRHKIDAHVEEEYVSIKAMQSVVQQRRAIMQRTVSSLIAERRVFEAGTKRIEALRAQAQTDQSHGLELEISQLDAGLVLLMNSIDTLESYRVALYNGVMEAITSATSSYRLIATVTSSANIAIQNIKENAAVYSTGQKTRVALDLEKRLNEMSNAISRDTSDMVRKNALETTKALVAPTITLETLEHGCNNLIESSKETHAVITQWLQERQANATRLAAVRERLRDVVVQGGLIPKDITANVAYQPRPLNSGNTVTPVQAAAPALTASTSTSTQSQPSTFRI